MFVRVSWGFRRRGAAAAEQMVRKMKERNNIFDRLDVCVMCFESEMYSESKVRCIQNRKD